MGLDELIARLERDADARVDAIVAAADAEVAAIDGAAARASARARDDELGRRREARRAALDRELAEARRKAREAELRAAHALLDRVFERVRARFEAAAHDPAYVAGLARRLDDALAFLGGGEAVVRCRPSLAIALRAAIDDNPAITLEEVDDAPLGVIVRARDGSVEIDDTLDARLARLRPRLAIELLAEAKR